MSISHQRHLRHSSCGISDSMFTLLALPLNVLGHPVCTGGSTLFKQLNHIWNSLDFLIAAYSPPAVSICHGT